MWHNKYIAGAKPSARAQFALAYVQYPSEGISNVTNKSIAKRLIVMFSG